MAPQKHDAFTEMRELARFHLKLCGQIHSSPTNLHRLLDLLDIPVVAEPFLEDATFTGTYYWRDDGFRIIVVNSLLPMFQQRNVIAVQIGHLVMEDRPPHPEVVERLATCYASEVLMPTERLVEQVRCYGAGAPFLAGINGVSVASMRTRLQELAGELARDHDALSG